MSCTRIMAVIFVAIAMLASVGAVFGPTWMSVAIGGIVTTSTGFFWTCTFFYDSSQRVCEFGIAADLPDWYLAALVLLVISMALLVVAFVGGLCMGCNESCERSLGFPVFLFIITFLAFACCLSGTVVDVLKRTEGEKTTDYFKRQETGVFFDWAVYLAIVEIITSFFGAILFLVVRCQNNSKVGVYA